jgi:hypothetical protein
VHWDKGLTDDPFELENQITNLDRMLESLSEDQGSVLSYIENREMMCPMCQELTEGIDAEEGRGELVRRLDRLIQKLDGKVTDEIEFVDPIAENGEQDDLTSKEPELMEFDGESDIERDERDEENLGVE